VPTTGEVTIGLFAKEMAMIATPCTEWSRARVAFHRKRLADLSAGTVRTGTPATAAAEDDIGGLLAKSR
jgi:hypothetical protein